MVDHFLHSYSDIIQRLSEIIGERASYPPLASPSVRHCFFVLDRERGDVKARTGFYWLFSVVHKFVATTTPAACGTSRKILCSTELPAGNECIYICY
jgi:hypothetical protein